MWPAIASWVKAIVVVVLLGNVADFLLPNSSLKRYAGFVVGLTLLLLMVRPLGALVLALEHPGHWPKAALSTSAQGSTQHLIRQEEQDQIGAMVESMSGVAWCRVHIQSRQVVVRVGLTRSLSHQTLTTYVQQAVADILQKPQVPVHLIRQVVASPPLPKAQ